MIHHYVMYKGRRCFPGRERYPNRYPRMWRNLDQEIKQNAGICEKHEIVSLDCFCVFDGKNIFDFATDYEGDNSMLMQTDFRDGKFYSKTINDKDIPVLVEKAKRTLTEERQLIYGELCIRDDMNLDDRIGGEGLDEWFRGLGERKYSSDRLQPMRGFPGFEFCGYAIMDTDCAIGALTDCGDTSEYHGNNLNRFGLIDTFEDAVKIQHKMKADIDVDLIRTFIYGVWRYVRCERA